MAREAERLLAGTGWLPEPLKSWTHLDGISYYGAFGALGLPSVEIAEAAVNLILLIVIDGMIAFRPDFLSRCRKNVFVATSAAVILIYDIALWGALGSFDFIYFQF